MSFNVLMSTRNYDASSGQLVYKFPSGVHLAGYEVGLLSSTFYNQFFNVSAALGNNQVILKYPIFTAANTYTMVSYTVMLADGYYTFSELNEAINNSCLNQGLYLLDGTGAVVTFHQITDNTVTYKTTISNYRLPTAAQATALGFTNPGGLAILNPGNLMVTPQVQIVGAQMAKLTGFNVGTYPATPITSSAATWSPAAALVNIGSGVPAVNMVNSLIVRLNAVSVQNSSPADMLALMPITASYGGQVNYTPSVIMWSPCTSGTQTELVVSFVDQNLAEQRLFDPDLSVVLMFRKVQ